MRKIAFGKSKMPAVETYADDCRQWIARAAAHRRGSRKIILAQIAREVGLDPGRVCSLFYGKVRCPNAAEWDALRQWQAAERDRERTRLLRRLEELSRGR